MELHQIDAISLQALERFVDLPGGGGFGAAIDLGHEKDFVAVAVRQGIAHADLADAVVVIPAVVHEGNAVVDGAAHQLNGFLLIERGFADVVPAQPDDRDTLPGAPQCAIDHSIALRSFLVRAQHGCQQLFRGGNARRRRCSLQKNPPVHDPS